MTFYFRIIRQRIMTPEVLTIVAESFNEALDALDAQLPSGCIGVKVTTCADDTFSV